ncbi:hypothetical protein [Hafnia sp. HMSC23F03]|uniref:hypothetical protein n=1 Tax=Hafnia sp. HMSC23F03 TaxID=1581059 RepID=UPI00143BFFBC|nr:hypothetical protein [Hafnia sp. HMSC23F03]
MQCLNTAFLGQFYGHAAAKPSAMQAAARKIKGSGRQQNVGDSQKNSGLVRIQASVLAQ